MLASTLPCPLTDTMVALNDKFSQPLQIVLRCTGAMMEQSTTVLQGAKDEIKKNKALMPGSFFNKNKNKPCCPFCNKEEHYLSQCKALSRLTKDQLTEWIKSNKRCWRCARLHQIARCNLKKTYSLCQGKHLQVLHDVILKHVRSHRQ